MLTLPAKLAPQTSQAVPPEQVDPLGESQQPDELGESPQPELKEEPGESLPAELAPRTSEEGMPPTSGEMTPAEEARMDADAEAAENHRGDVATRIPLSAPPILFGDRQPHLLRQARR